MAQHVVTLHSSNRKSSRQETALAVIEQMYAYFDPLESRAPTDEDTLPQAA